jgi:hypothetical protein
MARKTRRRRPYRHRPARRLSLVYANDMADFWLVFASPHAAGAIELQGSIALSIFYLSLYLLPKMMGTRPLPRHAFCPFASPLQCLPLPPTPLFSWLLHITTKRQPPKTGAPPISQFFHGRHFGAQNKETKRSARAPGRRSPPSCSWGAVDWFSSCVGQKGRKKSLPGTYPTVL